MPKRDRIGGALRSCALVLLAGALAPASGQTLVKAAPGSAEVKASHGRTWVAFPDPLFTIRMDRDGKVTGTAAPIGVAHEEDGAMCAAVRAVAAVSTKGAKMVTFTPAPRCSFSASEATLILPLDSIGKFAAVCNEPSYEGTSAGQGCRPDLMNPGKFICQLPPIPGANPGPAWRRAEGWSGRVPFNGTMHVDVLYDRYAADHAKDVVNPGVQLTCDKVPCGMTWLGTPDQLGSRGLPDAYTGKPYRAQLFRGARPPLTFANTGVPEGMSISEDGYLTGTPKRTGFNQILVAFTESFACPWNATTLRTNGGNSKWSGAFKVTVKDGEPPTIAAFATSPDTLPAGGGDVVVTLQASDNDQVAKVLSSRAGPNANHTAAMTLSGGNAANGTWKITWPVPGNTTASPVVYTIKAWAVDRTNNAANATPKTVVVRAAGQAPPPIRRP